MIRNVSPCIIIDICEGCKPSILVLENLLEYNPVGKGDGLISVDELPRSIMKLKNDQLDLGLIGSPLFISLFIFQISFSFG